MQKFLTDPHARGLPPRQGVRSLKECFAYIGILILVFAFSRRFVFVFSWIHAIVSFLCNNRYVGCCFVWDMCPRLAV